MQLTVSQQDGYVLASTRGQIDEDAAELFRDQLHPLVGQRGTALVLDLSGSERINSVGIAHLVKLVSDANTNVSRVILAAPTPFVSSVLRITRLDRFFDLAESRDEAVQLVKAAAPAGSASPASKA
jgi:anti-anti-sigma factor